MKLVNALSAEGIKEVSALATDNDDGLAHFIEANISSLKDPYEGDLLDSSWQDLVETKDAHSYGAFALTKFYDPASDIGLGHNWEDGIIFSNAKRSSEESIVAQESGSAKS